MSSDAKQRIAVAALVFIAAVWGLTFVMVQDAVAELPVSAFMAYRFLAAALIVAVVFWRPLTQLSAAGWRAGIAMGMCLSAGYFAQTFALQHTTASNAGFITGLLVVLTPVLGLIVLRENPSVIVWIAAGVSALGLALLSGIASGKAHPLGDALAFGCALGFAAHILVTSRAVARHHLGALLVVQLSVVGVLGLLVAIPTGDLESPIGWTVWNALLVTSLIATALGFFVQSYAQKHASPARTALILASEPAFAGIFGYLLAGDRHSALGWTGAGLIIVAIIAVDLVPRLRPPRPLPEA